MKLVIAATILLGIMLILLIILLRILIRKINENGQKYFVEKIQNYDYVLDEKTKELNDIKGQIENSEAEYKNILNGNNNGITNQNGIEDLKNSDDEQIRPDFEMDIPEYREINFFSNYKHVKEVFTVNNEKIIKQFVEKSKNSSEGKEYRALCRIKKKFNSNAVYGCLTLSSDEQKEVLDETLTDAEKKAVHFDDFVVNKENFKITDLMNYINNRMEQIEPIIYVYVNGANEDYSYIDKNIRMIQYENMSEGIIIRYRDKLYDYSI